MAKREPNKPIGTCPCPFRECTETVPVFRYRSRTDDPAKQRHAGRLYLMCPKHRKSEDQEWILNNGDIKGADESSVEAPDISQPKKKKNNKSAPRGDAGGFGFFQ